MEPMFNPSLMCMDLLDIKNQAEILNERCDLYHVDIMDGHFVKNITLSPDFVKVFSTIAKKPIDCHLMVTDPDDYIEVLAENGAGKTTAVKLLCGLYYPTSGEILINGKSSRDFSSDSYFNLFSAVFQDYYFMPMTIAENICTASDYDRKKLFAAFDKAGKIGRAHV